MENTRRQKTIWLTEKETNNTTKKVKVILITNMWEGRALLNIDGVKVEVNDARNWVIEFNKLIDSWGYYFNGDMQAFIEALK